MKNTEDALMMLGRTNVADVGKADRIIRGARKEVQETEKAKRLLREMFRDGKLDPYSTSDGAPEYFLKTWCGYEESDT